jgi:hypothetical protein
VRAFVAILASVSLAFLLSACRNTSGTSSSEPRKDAGSPTDYYIPRDLDDALTEVDRIMGAKGREDVLKASERDMIQHHFGSGQWMRNSWGLWKGLRLAQYFNQLGIYHPDDMSGIILDSYWRRIHGQPIDLEGQVRYYQDYWKKMKIEGSGEPDGPANGSQPIRSETNRTSSAAGSRR